MNVSDLKINISSNEINQTWRLEPLLPEGGAVWILPLLVAITSVTVIGNVLVIASIFGFSNLRQPPNFLLASLAFADLLMGVIFLPLKVVYDYMGWWPFGKLSCLLWSGSTKIAGVSAVYSMCSIALDRYWAVQRPLDYEQERTPLRMCVMIAVSWILGTASASIHLLGVNDLDDVFRRSSQPMCRVNRNASFVMYISLSSFLIPVFLLHVCYLRVYLAVRRQLRSSLPPADQTELNRTGSIRSPGRLCRILGRLRTIWTNTSKTTTSREDPTGSASFELNSESNPSSREINNFILEKRRAIIHTERRALMVLGMLLAIFTLALLPFATNLIIESLCSNCLTKSRIRDGAMVWIASSNSMFNPFVYAMTNSDMRTAFVRILTCRYNRRGTCRG